MQMDFSHWMALESAMQGEQPRRTLQPAPPCAASPPSPAPTGGRWSRSSPSASSAPSSPSPRRCWPGQVVDEIIDGEERGAGSIGLAVLIALIALLDAVVGIAERWQSSKIGEGLILDLRRAVFGHVQRMPVAFFTRTRTGALVSRLEQRRDRRPAGLHLDAVGRRQQR